MLTKYYNPDVYTILSENTRDGFFLLNEQKIVQYVNPAFLSITYIKEQDVIGNDFRSLFATRNQKVYKEIWHELQNKGKWQGEVCFSSNGRDTNSLSLHLEKVIHDNVVSFIGIVSSLSEQIVPKQDHQLFSRVYENVSEGIMITDKSGVIVSVNSGFFRTTGYSNEEAIGKTPNLLNSGYHEKDFFIKMWSEIHDKGSWYGEIWNRKKNGEMYLERLSINSIKNKEGDITHYVGIFQDITEQRSNENNLRLYSRVFENSSEGVMITDKNGVIISVNPAFVDTTGYSEKEAIGESPSILHSGRHGAEFYISMWASIHDTGNWQGEIWNKRKSGEIYPELLSINAVTDEHGDITNYVGIFSDITNQKNTEDELKYLAHYDNLTGIPNRFQFEQKLNQELERAKLNHNIISVFFLDLNRFKMINDTLGHSVGDQLLITFSNRLKDALKGRGTIARLGGDEFTILLSDVESVEEIESIANYILDSVSGPFQWETEEYYITCSIGISMYPYDGVETENLIKNADTAMYRAKKVGQGYQFYEKEMYQPSTNNMKLSNHLHKALDREEFIIYYQPQVDIATGNIVGLEALLRWKNNEMGLVSPGQFMPIAEDSGLIIPIGYWVLKTVAEKIRDWESKGYHPIKVAVNLSAHQFMDEELIHKLELILKETELDPQFLELEITESVSIHNIDSVLQTLKEIKLLGINVSIDDFGTGHSSLSYLKKYPVKTLKIDQTFIRNVEIDKKSASIVKAIIQMADGLDLNVIAEGVETKQELSFLKDNNCQYVQGFLYGKPMPAEEIEDILSCGVITL